MPSVRHQLVARVVPAVRRTGRGGTDPETLRRSLLDEQRAARTGPPPRMARGFVVSTATDLDFPVHELRPTGTDPRRTLLYVHGGGYVSHADRVHWRYVTRLAARTGSRVLFPDYPLAPSATWRASFPQMLALFERAAVSAPGGVVLAGDSAGGGYALALAVQLAGSPGPQPTHLVLHAPWVDLTTPAPGIGDPAHRDPLLRSDRLHRYARWWAGRDALDRPELSPIHGDLSPLPPALVFCGTRDLLCPQNRLLAERAARQGWDLTYVEEPDLLHVYPLLPVPEARRALAATVRFLG